jgi:bacterioferritin (cytochrome b1)
MTDFSALDDIIYAIGQPDEPAAGVSLTEAGLFFVGLKKAAAATPDTTGQLEGQFAAPVEHVAQTMAQAVSHELRMQAAYLYYSQMVRDAAHEALSALFLDHAQSEMRDAEYLLRRISVLVPGGVPIPVPPMPEPLTDLKQILQVLIAGEQQVIVLLRTLRAQLGENPTRYTVEQMLAEEQEHLDKLWQHMPAAPALSPEKKAAQKIASAARLVAATRSASSEQMAGRQSPESSMLQEQALALAEMNAVAAHHAQRAQTMEQQLLAGQQQVQNATMAAQGAQQQAATAQQQAAQAMEQATANAENAAQQADAKMRLAMRIQQFRQQLADIVSTDPVQEEGVGFGEQAGAGGPRTVPQQQQQQQAAAEQQAQQAQQMQAPVTPREAAREQEEAARAQNQAEQQAAQAEQAGAAVAGAA